MIVSRPSYKRRPIASTAALARALGTTVEQLRSLAVRADGMYRLVERKAKKGGGYREIFDAREPLKTVQKRIHSRILASATYPYYLMGGIKDPDHRRGYLRSAGMHAGASMLVSEDIADFFPSVSTAKVQSVFQHVLHFPPSVAGMLAGLCTRRGQLPQGASTSTSLANLVLHQQEPDLVEYLTGRGYRYSRFVDDVNVSTERPVTDDDVHEVVCKVRELMERSGFQPKRKKQFIGRRGQHFTIHNLNVDSRATIPLAERKKVRAMVYQLERQLAEGPPSATFRRELDRATSHAARVRQLHPREGQALMSRIRGLRQLATVNPGS